MDEVAPPPDEIGAVTARLHLTPEDLPQPDPVARAVKTTLVGLMFSVVPVILTHFVLTRGEAGFDPVALAAAIPVLFTAFSLLKPRERWYALGEDGLALGERFFGQVRWEAVRYDEVGAVEIRLKRYADSEGQYRFTGYRYAFQVGNRRRVVLEGEVREPEPRGRVIRLPDDAELPERHELRIARTARAAWEARTGKKADIAAS